MTPGAKTRKGGWVCTSPPAHTKALMARTLQQMLLLCSEMCLTWTTLQKPVSPLPLCVYHGLALEGCLQKAALGKALRGLEASRAHLTTRRRERLKVCEGLHKESSSHHPALMTTSCSVGDGRPACCSQCYMGTAVPAAAGQPMLCWEYFELQLPRGLCATGGIKKPSRIVLSIH